MSDALKTIYAREGKSSRYFDGETPCELYRGQHPSEHKKGAYFMAPVDERVEVDPLTKQSVVVRQADVKVVMRDGQRFVLGVRCTKGDFRGLSLFDKPMSWFKPSWYNFKLPRGAKIPENLAIVKDDFNPRRDATHYTIAPKDDMTYELFMQSLKVVASQTIAIGKQGAAS